jgi:hypothetical protein
MRAAIRDLEFYFEVRHLLMMEGKMRAERSGARRDPPCTFDLN